MLKKEKYTSKNSKNKSSSRRSWWEE